MIELDESLTIITLLEIFLLLLIGIGPKIALVPFLTATADMTPATRRPVLHRMVLTAAVVAVVLLVLGKALTRLLHFSPGALSVASGTILLIIAVNMVLARPDGDDPHAVRGRDPMRVAVVPLAVPYLLNPVGIVVLVTVSAEGDWPVLGATVGALAVVLALDLAVFHWAGQGAHTLSTERLLVVEKVFGFLLAALAVQLALHGLASLGIVHLAAGH